MKSGMTRPRRVLWLFATALFLAPICPAIASEMGQAAAARVSEDSYRHFLDDMLFTHLGDNRGFGPEHDLAQANIYSLMLEYGLAVTLEPVDYPGDGNYNVVGTKLGVTYPDQEYVIGAHYDSVDNPGADDNASGVALVLEAARVLGAGVSDYTIRFVAFDREEQGLFGSQDYVAAHIDDDILGMISADMVAYNNGENHVDIYGRAASNTIKNALAEAVATYGGGLTSTKLGPLDASDHAPFEWEGIPACLLIEDWGNPHYHTQWDSVDTSDYIDYAYATQITRVVVGFLVDRAGVTLELPTGDFDADGDVDLDDADAFFACFTGSNGGPIEPQCFAGDFDFDGDVDCTDWEQFILAWTEPGTPPEFADCAVASALTAWWPHDAAKNRYISFDPNNNDLSVAFQVELTGSAFFPDAVGLLGWVGEPDEHGVARLTDEPVFAAAWPAVVHVGDCGIIPAASYDVRTTINGLFFSDPLALATIAEPAPKHWGDCVGPFDGAEWTAPDAEVSMDDIMAAVQSFKQLPTAPPLTWVDIDPEVPNLVLNFTDILRIVHGFQGEPYPFSDPVACP